MKDVVGNKLEVGDIVTCTYWDKPRLVFGRVVKLTSQRIAVRQLTAASGLPGYRPDSGTLKRSDQVTLVSRDMRDWDDIEVFLHIKRLVEED